MGEQREGEARNQNRETGGNLKWWASLPCWELWTLHQLGWLKLCNLLALPWRAFKKLQWLGYIQINAINFEVWRPTYRIALKSPQVILTCSRGWEWVLEVRSWHDQVYIFQSSFRRSVNWHNAVNGQFGTIDQQKKCRRLLIYYYMSRNLFCRYACARTQRHACRDIHCSIVCDSSRVKMMKISLIRGLVE